MADSKGDFDPYYKWLGIAKDQRPPNHYRLLGLAPGESNVAVIEEAVIRQTAHIRTHQLGPNGSLCTKLLNEIAQARLILINAKKRQEYDKQHGIVASRPALPNASPMAAANSHANRPASKPAIHRDNNLPAANPLEDALVHAPAGLPARKKGSSATLVVASVAGAIAAVSIVVIGIVLWMASQPTDVPERPRVVKKQDPDRDPPPKPPEKKTDTTVAKVDPKTDPKIDPKTDLKTDPSIESIEITREAITGDWLDADSGRRLVISDQSLGSAFPWAVTIFRDNDIVASSYKFKPAGARLSGPIDVIKLDPEYPRSAIVDLKLVGKDRLTETVTIDGGPRTRTFRRVDPPAEMLQMVGKWFGQAGKRDYFVDVTHRDNAFEVRMRVLEDEKELPIEVKRTCRDVSQIWAELHSPISLIPPTARFQSANPGTLRMNLGSSQTRIDLRPALPDDPPPRTKTPVIVKNPPPAAKKQPVPPDEEVAKATKQIREALAKDYTAAKKDPADRIALVAKLVKQGRATSGDAAERFAFFAEAKDQAGLAGNWTQANGALDLLSNSFEIDTLAQRETTLRAVVKATNVQDQLEDAADAALDSVHSSLSAERFDLAGKFANAGLVAALKMQNTSLQSQFTKLEAECKIVEDDFKKMTEGLKTLMSKDDPTAHHDVGRYLALRQHDWKEALPHLAKAGDHPYALAAQKDLENPTDAKKQQDAGEAWWLLAEKETQRPMARAALAARARHWLAKAAPNSTGLALLAINERMRSINDVPNPATPWDAGGAEVRRFKGHTGAVNALVVPADGKRFFSAGEDGTIRVWDPKNTKQLSGFKVGSPVLTLDFSPDDTYFATVSRQRRLQVWSNVANPSVIYSLTDAALGIHWNDRSQISVVQGQNFRMESIPNTGGSSGPVGMEADRLIGKAGSGVMMMLGPTEVMLGRFGKLNIKNPTCAAIAPSEAFVLIGTGDKTVRKFSATTRAQQGMLSGLTGAPKAVAISPSSRLVAVACDDKTVHVWDADFKRLVVRLPQTTSINAVAFSADDRSLLAAGDDGGIRMFNLPREKQKTP